MLICYMSQVAQLLNAQLANQTLSGPGFDARPFSVSKSVISLWAPPAGKMTHYLRHLDMAGFPWAAHAMYAVINVSHGLWNPPSPKP